MRVAIYARVSTIDKDQDPEVQLRRLREWASARGDEVIGEYKDYASGADPNRPGLVELLDTARRRSFESILVVRLDRIMRSVRNLQTLIEDLDRWGVGISCLDQPIETKTATGRLLLTIISAFAEFELDLIRERTIDGMAKARATGTKSGKPIGRVRSEIDMDAVSRLLAEGRSERKIASTLGISRTTLRRHLEEADRNGGGRKYIKKKSENGYDREGTVSVMGEFNDDCRGM